MTYQARIISYDNRARIFWFLISALVLLVCIQIVAVGATTKSVAERQTLEKQVQNLTAKAGELEFNYITLRNQVDISLAYEKGYKETKDPTYASRVSQDSLGTLTLSR